LPGVPLQSNMLITMAETIILQPMIVEDGYTIQDSLLVSQPMESLPGCILHNAYIKLTSHPTTVESEET
jgi:hypothetical protein